MAARTEKTKYPGIYRCHSRGCDVRGTKCSCPSSYEASVYLARERKLVRKRFNTLGAAKTWREDAAGAVRRGTMKPRTSTTVAQATDEWLQGAREGKIRNRSGDPYKPSAFRGYERALRLRVLPHLGHLRLTSVERNDVQDLADVLLAKGLTPSTVKNTLNPLQAIYRRAVQRGIVAVNPTVGLELPAVRSGRDRIASREEAAALIAAAPDQDRALWATAFYVGLRRGELRELRWRDVDLTAGVIRVERALDDKGEVIETKTKAGRRAVPVTGGLRRELVAHKLATGREGDGLVFGATPTLAFEPSTVRRRALAAWKAGKLKPIGLHEARHTAASFFIAAGLNVKELSSYMGHASVTITLDRYGHLLPGSQEEAAARLDAYFAQEAATAIRMECL